MREGEGERERERGKGASAGSVFAGGGDGNRCSGHLSGKDGMARLGALSLRFVK